MVTKNNNPIQFTGFDGIEIRSHQGSNIDYADLLKRAFYGLYLLLSVSIFAIGLLAISGNLPQRFMIFNQPIDEQVAQIAMESETVNGPTAIEIESLQPEQVVRTDLSTTPATQEISLSTSQRKEQAKAIQILLLELGYKPGKVDGVLGKKSQKAFDQFQSDYGITSDITMDRPTQTLALLQQHAPTLAKLPNGYTKLKINVQRPIVVPKYGRLTKTKDDWECKSGFRRANDRCILVSLPNKALLNEQGDDWECLPGYRKDSKRNICRPIPIPANALLNYSKTGWDCIRGYKRNGNQCSPIRIPQNASLNSSGNDWKCDVGFEKKAQLCV